MGWECAWLLQAADAEDAVEEAAAAQVRSAGLETRAQDLEAALAEAETRAAAAADAEARVSAALSSQREVRFSSQWGPCCLEPCTACKRALSKAVVLVDGAWHMNSEWFAFSGCLLARRRTGRR